MSKLNILLLVFLFHLASISLYAQENKTKIVIANERESSTFHHTVEKGETVYAIATMYGVKPEDIYRLNPGSKEGIRAGATLQIPQRTASQKEEHYIFHTIQPKETLYAVSKRYAVPATAIVNANPGLSTSTFQIGKTIRIPTFVKDEGEEESHQKEVSTEAEEIEYTIEKRETLYRICRKFDISSYELLKRNPQLKEGVKAGMKIKIPVLTQKEKPQPEQTAPLNERETNALLAQKPKSEPVQRIKVALLLPFMTNETEPSAETKRFIEYYEGFLIAVDSLRNSGCSIELSVYERFTLSGLYKFLDRVAPFIEGIIAFFSAEFPRGVVVDGNHYPAVIRDNELCFHCICIAVACCEVYICVPAGDKQITAVVIAACISYRINENLIVCVDVVVVFGIGVAV